jgi:hypothetical protein
MSCTLHIGQAARAVRGVGAGPVAVPLRGELTAAARLTATPLGALALVLLALVPLACIRAEPPHVKVAAAALAALLLPGAPVRQC